MFPQITLVNVVAVAPAVVGLGVVLLLLIALLVWYSLLPQVRWRVGW